MSKMSEARRKKVLFIITKSNFGGAQRYVFDLATNLPKNEFDVAVACGGKGELVKRLDAYGIRVLPIPSLERDISVLKEVKSFFELFAIIRAESPDVLHVNSAKAAGLGALAGRLLGVPHIVFTGHGWAFNEERPYWQKALIALFLYITILLVHRTIAVSEKEKRDIVTHIPSFKERISVIYNGTSVIQFEPRDVSRRILASFAPVELNDPDVLSGYWIGFHGELHKNKGIDIAIKALKPVLDAHPNAYGIIVGVGDWMEKMKILVSELGLEKRVFFLGAVPDARNYLRAHDVFILPSRKEALPYGLIEAGFAILPVVSTTVGGIPEIIESGKSGLLVPPRDIEAVTRSIESIMCDEAKAKSYGSGLSSAVSLKFNLEKMVDETKHAYFHG